MRRKRATNCAIAPNLATRPQSNGFCRSAQFWLSRRPCSAAFARAFAVPVSAGPAADAREPTRIGARTSPKRSRRGCRRKTSLRHSRLSPGIGAAGAPAAAASRLAGAAGTPRPSPRRGQGKRARGTRPHRVSAENSARIPENFEEAWKRTQKSSLPSPQWSHPRRLALLRGL